MPAMSKQARSGRDESRRDGKERRRQVSALVSQQPAPMMIFMPLSRNRLM